MQLPQSCVMTAPAIACNCSSPARSSSLRRRNRPCQRGSSRAGTGEGPCTRKMWRTLMSRPPAFYVPGSTDQRWCCVLLQNSLLRPDHQCTQRATGRWPVDTAAMRPLRLTGQSTAWGAEIQNLGCWLCIYIYIERERENDRDSPSSAQAAQGTSRGSPSCQWHSQWRIGPIC